MTGSGRRIAALGLLAGVLAAGTVQAQTDPGGQRIGTSAGVFLKIPVDARSSAMANATSAYVSGPAALFTNPAGLGVESERGLVVAAVDYPADIPMGGFAFCFPFAPLQGSLGIGMTGLSTWMDETDEYHPLGTGRDFSYSAWSLLLGASRALTDKLSFGLTARWLHESLGSEVGGPDMNAWLLDAGAIYFVGYRDSRIGISLSSFGPDLTPDGEFISRRDGSHVPYTSFSPPTFFHFAFTIDPLRGARWRTATSIEFGHPADHREALRVGGELVFDELLFLRSGYDFSADALNFHAGCGVRVRLGERVTTVDYSYSDGSYFGEIQRCSLQLLW